jgi:hypothetical protein
MATRLPKTRTDPDAARGALPIHPSRRQRNHLREKGGSHCQRCPPRLEPDRSPYRSRRSRSECAASLMWKTCIKCGKIIPTSMGSRCADHPKRWRSGSTREWRKTRARILERDGNRCTVHVRPGQRCEGTTLLEVQPRRRRWGRAARSGLGARHRLPQAQPSWRLGGTHRRLTSDSRRRTLIDGPSRWGRRNVRDGRRQCGEFSWRQPWRLLPLPSLPPRRRPRRSR